MAMTWQDFLLTMVAICMSLYKKVKCDVKAEALVKNNIENASFLTSSRRRKNDSSFSCHIVEIDFALLKSSNENSHRHSVNIGVSSAPRKK